uniref:Uncharacterized protein n=1 Tax=Varanus komodoensis TaxID=61221 RepID=A0A8D2J944_VARKO
MRETAPRAWHSFRPVACQCPSHLTSPPSRLSARTSRALRFSVRPSLPLLLRQEQPHSPLFPRRDSLRPFAGVSRPGRRRCLNVGSPLPHGNGYRPAGSPAPVHARPRPPRHAHGGAELLSSGAVPVLPVNDAHLFEEGALAALARAQQQDLDEPFHPTEKGGAYSVCIWL